MAPEEALGDQRICCKPEQAATLDEEAMFRATSVYILLDLCLLLNQNQRDSTSITNSFQLQQMVTVPLDAGARSRICCWNFNVHNANLGSCQNALKCQRLVDIHCVARCIEEAVE